MMTKVISPAGWDFGTALTEMVKVSSRGLIGSDRNSLIKRAGYAFANLVDHSDLKPGDVPIHQIAMGATERYLANRNGDGFKRANLIRTIDTFVKRARYYRNHQNKDPRKSYGVIKRAAYHDPMDRVELLIFLNGTKEAADRNGGLVADRELQQLEKTGELAGSMACIWDPESLICTPNGYIPIKSIRPGMLVPTHADRWQKVTELRRRKYSGKLLSIKLDGLPEPLQLTSDHPMYAKLLSQYAAMSQGQRPAGQWAREVSEGATAFEWQCSEHLQPGDRLNCRKLPRVPGVAGISSIPLAALLGTYIAEGNVSYCKDNPNIVVYTVNAADWAVRGVPAAVEAYWPDVTCNLEPKKNSKVSFSILVNSSELARWCVRLHGSGVWNKTIPAELLNATNEAKREFMGRWLDGDGWCDKKGGHWSSCNYGLIMQGRDLLLTLGIAASIYKIDHAKCETSGYQGSGIEYTLNVSNFDLETLVGHSQKISNNPYLRSAKEKKKEHQVCLYPVGDTTAYRVKSIGITEAENVDVWNFEVEYDHSYSLAGVISHNCTVPNDECSSCGNLAPTREEYCLGEDEGGHCKHGGCRNRLTRVCEDGHVLHVDNPDPTFIDFSNVVRPADRIAYGGMADYLMKAASGSAVGGAELAEQIGLTVPLDIAFSYAMRGRPHVEPQFKLACAFAVLEQSVPVSPVYGATPAAQFSTAQLGKPGTTKFAEALTALADEGIILPLHTFCELWSGDAKVEKAAQVALTGIYTRLIRSADFPEKLAGHIFQPARTTTSAAKTWARKQAADFSVLPEHIENRRWLAALNGTTDNNFVKSKQASDITESASSAADGMQIAERYAVYKLAALCKIAELTDDFALTAVTALHQNHH